MLEKLKKNMNEWYSHSLGIMILAIVVVLDGHIEISFAIYATSIVLMGIGALYNQNKKQSEILIEISSNQRFILEELKNDRKYEYKKDGATIMLNKAELLNIFMKKEREAV